MRCYRMGDVLAIAFIEPLGRNYDEIIDEWRRITMEKGTHVPMLDIPLVDTRNRSASVGGILIEDAATKVSYLEGTSQEMRQSCVWA